MNVLNGQERSVVEFRGSTHFRYRIVAATLAQRAIRISDIRASTTLNESERGVRDFEASFLRLLEKVSVGARVRVSTDGTVVEYVPGVISTSGSNVTIRHECALSRGIGYYLEALIALAPFGKHALSVVLSGVTNNDVDVSPDTLRTVTLPLLANFGLEDGLELKIVRRGAPPLGGGVVEFKCPAVKSSLHVAMLVDEGLVRRVRGIVYSMRVSPILCNRVITATRGVLGRVTSDLFMYADSFNGVEAGNSPGYGVVLVAETTAGGLLSIEVCARKGELPEDVGARAAALFLEEVARRGVCDSTNQPLMLLFMLLCDEEVSRVRFGRLTPFTIQFLRDLKDIFGVEFKLEEDTTNDTVIVTCLGIGYINRARRLK